MKKITFLLASLLTFTASLASIINVRDYGAKGDGDAIDSPAINAAISAAAEKGGGTVLFPRGVYLSYSLRLQSNITLRFDDGAVLKAAPVTSTDGYDPAEENTSTYQDFGHSHWKNSLLWGIGLKNIAIVGHGLIDGTDVLNRGAFLRMPKGDATFGPANKALALRDCRNVRIQGMSFLSCGHFAMLLTGVDNLRIEDVLVDSNRDGIDIDCCENVRIRRCKVNTVNDDAIVLKCSYALNRLKPTANVLIEDCDVSGYDVGTMLNGTLLTTSLLAPDGDGPTGRIKLGTESNGGFRNIRIRNCRFCHCRGLALETVDGAPMENITVRNITMTDICNSPLYIRIGKRMRGPEGLPYSQTSKIRISNITVTDADCRYACLIAGIEESPVRDVKITDVDISYRGGLTLEDVRTQAKANTFFLPKKGQMKALSGYPEPSAHGIQPAWGINIYDARDITLKNVKLTLLSPDERPSHFQHSTENVVFK